MLRSLGVPALQVIRDLCIKYSMNEPETLIAGQSIIEDGTFAIPRVIELTSLFISVKKTYETHEKKHETEVSLMEHITTQHTSL